MSTMKTLMERLEAQKSEGSPHRALWEEAVRQLVDNVRAWLKVPEQRGLLQIDEQPLELSEPGLGTCRVPGLTITTETQTIWMRPLGVEKTLAGEAFRVEIWSTDAGFTLLYLTDGEWVLHDDSESPDDWPVVDENQFEKIMVKLVEA